MTESIAAEWDFMAWIVAALTWFFGGLDGVVKILIAFAVIDYMTGICAAGLGGEISSRVGIRGIAKKLVMFCFVGIANIIDTQMIGGTDAFRTVVCLFYIGNEGISIIENACKLGVPFPEALKKHFEQLQAEHEHEPEHEKSSLPESAAKEHLAADLREGEKSALKGGEE